MFSVVWSAVRVAVGVLLERSISSLRALLLDVRALLECCWSVVRVLLEHCWSVVRALLECCWMLECC